jgi:hypothetical protein
VNTSRSTQEEYVHDYTLISAIVAHPFHMPHCIIIFELLQSHHQSKETQNSASSGGNSSSTTS